MNHYKCLPPIDPTKLPRSEPILVTVTARLNYVVSKKFKGCWSSDKNKPNKEKWQQQLQQLERGLRLLNDKEYKPEYFSEALQLNAQLEYSMGGQDLSAIFGTLVELACDILECKAILISFDDIDTQFDTGWTVLESIRKFFNSNRLIVIATGDLRLYSQLIRGKQYENYSQVLLEQESETKRTAERGYMVEHLEQQYLLKIFPVQKRIQLKNMLQLVGEKGQELSEHEEILIITDSGDSVGIRKALEDSVRDGLNIRSYSDLNIYVDEMLKQPVRLLMQVLQDYYTKISTGVDKPLLFRNALYGAMLSSIYRAGLNYEQHRFGMDSICKDVFIYTRQDQDLNTGFYLRPQSDSEALRNCSIYLSAQVGAICQRDLSKVLQMLLVGCGSISIFNQFVMNLGVSKIQGQTDDQIANSYVSYMSVGRRESATHWANRCCAVISGYANIGVFLGMVQLNRKGGKKADTYSAFKLNQENGLAKASMAASLSSVSGSNLTDYTSVFNLIGAISDLSSSYAGEDGESKTASFVKSFNKIISQPTCIVPPWKNEAELAKMKSGSDETIQEDYLIDDVSDSDGYKKYSGVNNEFTDAIESLEKWVEYVHEHQKNIKPSSILIGKIWTRLYFNLNNIADKHRVRLHSDADGGAMASQSNAAKIMRFNVLAFLHAVLVEEDLYHAASEKEYLGSGLRLNPVTSVDVFTEKLEEINKKLDSAGKSWVSSHPIFYFLIKCPLLHPFLFPVGGMSVDTMRSSEQKFYDIVLKVLGETDFHGLRFDDLNNSTNKLESSFSIKTLNCASIAGAKYDTSTPRGNSKSTGGLSDDAQ
ncbi:archaeal ATPase [Oceanobacter sp. 2_MG-2023]|nr:archaeal ATPase [Oceanobacter sp. 2_MG-2023]